MNTRIKELAKQSGIWFEDNKDIRTHSVSTTTLEKFAESIIEECAKQAEYNGYNQQFGQGGLRTKLHEHFGITE
jgi:transketolase C-terminal domain/subunit